MHVVNRKETGNALFPGHGRDQTRHPVIAVDQVRLNPGNNVIDDFPLKCQGEFNIFGAVQRVDPVDIVEGPILGQMDAVVRHFSLNPVDFLI